MVVQDAVVGGYEGRVQWWCLTIGFTVKGIFVCWGASNKKGDTGSNSRRRILVESILDKKSSVARCTQHYC